jgi:hypothetical protein
MAVTTVAMELPITGVCPALLVPGGCRAFIWRRPNGVIPYPGLISSREMQNIKEVPVLLIAVANSVINPHCPGHFPDLIFQRMVGYPVTGEPLSAANPPHHSMTREILAKEIN